MIKNPQLQSYMVKDIGTELVSSESRCQDVGLDLQGWTALMPQWNKTFWRISLMWQPSEEGPFSNMSEQNSRAFETWFDEYGLEELTDWTSQNLVLNSTFKIDWSSLAWPSIQHQCHTS